jgi:hypothetical protein
MSKRPSIDLSALTADIAEPMAEAAQRTATPAPIPTLSKANGKAGMSTKTAELVPLSFKVPPEFFERYRREAFEADMKHNKFLFAMLDLWVEKHGKKNNS